MITSRLSLDVRSFGAVGDGAADDTRAVQRCLRAAAAVSGQVVFSPGVYRITDNLFTYGRTDVVGMGGRLLFDGKPTHERYFWAFGIDRYGANPENGGVRTWSGFLRDLTIVVSDNYQSRSVLIGLLNAEHWRMSNVSIDETLCTPPLYPCPISAISHAYWCIPYRVSHGVIDGCTLLANGGTAGNGGWSIVDASHVKVMGCDCHGFADDCGFTTSTDIQCCNNRLTISLGGIMLSGVTRAVVCGNVVSRVSKADGGGVGGGIGLIKTFLESARQPAPSDIVISDNIVRHSDDLEREDQGILLRAVRRCVCHDNLVTSSTRYGRGVQVEGYDVNHLGWTDPEGLDADGVARARDVSVHHNTCLGVPDGKEDSTYCFCLASVAENVRLRNNHTRHSPLLLLSRSGEITPRMERHILYPYDDQAADELRYIYGGRSMDDFPLTLQAAEGKEVTVVQSATTLLDKGKRFKLSGGAMIRLRGDGENHWREEWRSED